MAIDLPSIWTQHSSEKQKITHQVTLGQLTRLEGQFPEVGTGFVVFRSGSIRYFAFLGWLHRVQRGQQLPPFEEWADGLIDVGVVPDEDDDDEDEDPTEADPTL